MPEWKQQAADAYDARGPSEPDEPQGTTRLSRPDARAAVHGALKELGILGPHVEISAPEDESHAHVAVDGVDFYVGPGGELWGHVVTSDGEHSWDMPIRSLADAGELLAHHADIEQGIHPPPRAVPRAAEVRIGPEPDRGAQDG